MDLTTLYKQIEGVERRLARIESDILALKSIDIASFPSDYTALSMRIALQMESITCSVRHLNFATGTPMVPYMLKVSDTLGITVEHSDDAIVITLPGLLPKRKQKASCKFLCDPLFAALTQYTSTHGYVKFSDCVVCFTHIYFRGLRERSVRDYDNLELKHILDTIATFFLLDDSGLICDTYNTTQLGDKNQTRITIMQKNRFSNWIETLERGVLAYPN